MPALARALFERAAGDACLYEGRFVKVLHGGMVNASPGVATLLLRREPANAMSLDVWEELTAGLRAAEEDERTKALVVASATSRDIFTAGNDIKELHAPSTSEARFRRFWRAQTGCLVAYLRSPLPVAAAIGGACPAGGCALALCCERRVMLDSGNKATIGLNEVALGIAVPAHWGCRMAAVIGERRAEEMLTGGAMLPPKEAAAVGLVDALAGDEETLLRAAHNWAARAAKAAPQARARTKLALPGREAAAAAWWAQVDEEAAASWAMLSDKRVSGALGAVLQRLSSGGKKAVGKL